ncbi:methyl-accepting chemotaxis protein [Ramlibacter sp. AN1133]|uniref:methyl-accepting chemotaxis protein n=1 Tax=Ramlibacter sp. AN1133 TaxID=3133429 RepID=UPI0030BBD18A
MLAELRVRTKLFLLIAMLLLGMGIAGAYGVLALRQAQAATSQSMDVAQQLLHAVDSARSAQVSFKVQVHDFKNLLLRGHDQEQYDWYLAAFRKGRQAVDRDFDALAAAATGLRLPPERIAQARQQHAAIFQVHLDALQSFRVGSADSALDADRLVRGKDRQLDEQIGAIVQDLRQFADAEAAALRAQAQASTRRAVLFLGALVALLAVAASAAGVLAVRRLEAELGGEPSYARSVAERIAAGDLSVDVDLRSQHTASVVFAMRAMSEQLRRVVGQVSEAAGVVARSSADLVQGQVELSQRTEEQASTLEETASSMEEITSTVARNADSAREASELARTASEVARKGGVVVADVVRTMAGISESSRRIGDIIGVIDGIAFQTIILALNAAVEAARAGAQGRGFAVVAAEVRNLAQRSAEAAREIRALIGASVGQVEAGGALVQAAGETMNEIVDSVKKVSDLIAESALASQEQSGGIQQINAGLVQMEHAVQRNAGLVEEATAATGSLKEEAARLLALVSAFRLREDDGPPPAQQARRLARASALPALDAWQAVPQ